ncbi:Fc.00g032780.m01.CDS01 [Cosmosporella sp. VM-42]
MTSRKHRGLDRFLSKFKSKSETSIPESTTGTTPPSLSSSPAPSTHAARAESYTCDPAGSSSTDPSLVTRTPLQSLHERLWNQAYDELEENEPKVVEAYERILSTNFHGDDSESTLHCAKNETGQAQGTRSRRMERVVQAGLERTKAQAATNEKVDSGLQIMKTLRGVIDNSLKVAPEAAVAWAGVCIGLEILTNTVKEPILNRDGLTYVLSRMKWYWNLADLLLGENKASRAPNALKINLESQIIELYKKLLLYQMRSVCLHYRSRSSVLLRNVIKLDDWTGKLDEIKDLEDQLRKDSEQYNTEGIMSILGGIEEVANSQLQAVYSAIQDQSNQQQERFQDEMDRQCLRDLQLTDPRKDKKRIQESKGGLLEDCYHWILEHEGFQQFIKDPESRLLWIKGDPGKGKTMLLCGIIDEFKKAEMPLSYFFCQATEADLSNEIAILRGLIYVLVDQQPALISFIRREYDKEGPKLFEGINASVSLAEILTAMLQEPSLQNAILVVDALDECITTDRDKIIQLIVKLSGSSSAKWLISSRNWPEIEQQLWSAEKVKVQLELNRESISKAVHSYIGRKVDDLARYKRFYDESLKTDIIEYLVSNSDDTFLWVALVCQRLAAPSVRKRRDIRAELGKFPPGLVPFYQRMIEDTLTSEDSQLLQQVLATICVVERPITTIELRNLVQALQDYEDDELEDIIDSCGSFLTKRDDVVYFVHQSAKDFLLTRGRGHIFADGIENQHYEVFTRSIVALEKHLKRDIYGQETPGRLIDEISKPNPDPLRPVAYSCVYWCHHLIASDLSNSENMRDLQDVLSFLMNKVLYWLEAMSLLRSLSTAVRLIAELVPALGNIEMPQLKELVQDAHRFMLSYSSIVEKAPFQLYASALIFSPTCSKIRQQFRKEEPRWISLKPEMEKHRDNCLQNLEGHTRKIFSLNFSPDGKMLASASWDSTIRIWDLNSGNYIRKLHFERSFTLVAAAFSPDFLQVATALTYSEDLELPSRYVARWRFYLEIWSLVTCTRIKTLMNIATSRNSTAWPHLAFSADGRILAVASEKEVTMWDVATGVCAQTQQKHEHDVSSIAFSPDGKQLATGTAAGTAKVWDLASGKCKHTIHDPRPWAPFGMLLTFSPDGRRLVTTGTDPPAKIWNLATGECIQTLKGNAQHVVAVSFLADTNMLLADTGGDGIRFWDDAGTFIKTFDSQEEYRWLANSPAGNRLAVAHNDGAIRILDLDAILSSTEPIDATRKMADEQAALVQNTARSLQPDVTDAGPHIPLILKFSPDGKTLASCSSAEVNIWNLETGSCVISSSDVPYSTYRPGTVAFSHDSQLVAFELKDGKKGIWDLTTNKQTHALDTIPDKHHLVDDNFFFVASGQQLDSSHPMVMVWKVSERTRLCSVIGSWKPGVFSADLKMIASYGLEGDNITIHDRVSGDLIQELEAPDVQNPIAISSDCQWLALQSNSLCTIQVRHIPTGSQFRYTGDGQPENSLSFCDSADYRLTTEFGIVDLSQPPGPQGANFFGYGISSNRDWIMRGKERMLWIPLDYRKPLALDVVGFKVAMTSSSGDRSCIRMMQLV